MKLDKNKVTYETWNKVASLYEEKVKDFELYNDSYDIFLGQIDKTGAKVLEIGCGPGNITNYLLKKRPDLEVEGIDMSPNMIALAKKNNPTAKFKVMDCRNLDLSETKYDSIIIGFCMPYLSRAEISKLIKYCYSILTKNGSLYFSTIEGDYNNSRFETGSSGDKVYVYYHDEQFLRKVLEDKHFKLHKFMRKDYKKSEKINQQHIIMIAKKIRSHNS